MSTWAAMAHRAGAGAKRGGRKEQSGGREGEAMTGAEPVLAIDIGGTKIAAGLVEPGGRQASWAQAETPRGLDAEQLWRTLDVLLTRVLADEHVDPATGLAGVGVGCGGPMEWPAGRVSPLNIP